jgi:3-hydroxyacyl-CoA dehydrogenase
MTRIDWLSSTAVKDADLVIESIVEDLKLKQDLFAALDKVAK